MAKPIIHVPNLEHYQQERIRTAAAAEEASRRRKSDGRDREPRWLNYGPKNTIGTWSWRLLILWPWDSTGQVFRHVCFRYQLPPDRSRVPVYHVMYPELGTVDPVTQHMRMLQEQLPDINLSRYDESHTYYANAIDLAELEQISDPSQLGFTEGLLDPIQIAPFTEKGYSDLVNVTIPQLSHDAAGLPNGTIDMMVNPDSMIVLSVTKTVKANKNGKPGMPDYTRTFLPGPVALPEWFQAWCAEHMWNLGKFWKTPDSDQHDEYQDIATAFYKHTYAYHQAGKAVSDPSAVASVAQPGLQSVATQAVSPAVSPTAVAPAPAVSPTAVAPAPAVSPMAVAPAPAVSPMAVAPAPAVLPMAAAPAAPAPVVQHIVAPPVNQPVVNTPVVAQPSQIVNPAPGVPPMAAPPTPPGTAPDPAAPPQPFLGAPPAVTPYGSAIPGLPPAVPPAPAGVSPVSAAPVIATPPPLQAAAPNTDPACFLDQPAPTPNDKDTYGFRDDSNTCMKCPKDFECQEQVKMIQDAQAKG